MLNAHLDHVTDSRFRQILFLLLPARVMQSSGNRKTYPQSSRKFSLPHDREIIHTLPQEYIVDSQRGIRQPAGMYGARLEARVHVVTASRPALDNVAKTLHLAGGLPSPQSMMKSFKLAGCMFWALRDTNPGGLTTSCVDDLDVREIRDQAGSTCL